MSREEEIKEPLIEQYGKHALGGDSQKISFFNDPFYKKMTFSQITKIIDAGASRPYTYDMLYGLTESYTYSDYEQNFEKFFEKHQEAYKDDFLGLIFKFFRKYLMLVNFIYFLRYLVESLFPVFLKLLLEWVASQDEEDESKRESFNTGLIYAGLVGFGVFLRSYTGLVIGYINKLLGTKLRNVIRVST